jgi:hypothetical protein
MQGELYTQRPFGQHGPQEFSLEKLLVERAEYLVFNGAVGALTQAHPLEARVGETVRMFFGVGGPNYLSSFHVIGEIFDRVYQQAALTAPPLTDVQTTLVPAGGAAVVEFTVEVPGLYIWWITPWPAWSGDWSASYSSRGRRTSACSVRDRRDEQTAYRGTVPVRVNRGRKGGLTWPNRRPQRKASGCASSAV